MRPAFFLAALVGEAARPYASGMQDRPDIPAAVQLELRQRCGFGCVECGSPIYDYEHILGVAVTGDDPEFMTLLCPQLHREKTAGRLPVRLVQEWNAQPFNGPRQFTKGHELYFSSNESLTFMLGDDTRIMTDPEGSQACGITVDGDIALGGRIVDGHLRLDLDIRDLDNRPVLVVRDGVLRLAIANWDVTYTGKTIRVRSGMGEVALEMVVNADTSTITVATADVALHHVRIQIGRAALNRGLWLPNADAGLSGLTFEGGSVVLGTPRSGFLGIPFSDWPRAYGSAPAPVGSFRRAER
jgi:hypothetical protein